MAVEELSVAPAWTEIDWSVHARDAWIDGRRLHYVDYGSGPAIVLIHGLGGSWQTWLYNIPTLGLTHRVIAIDLPGFGQSDVLPPPAEMATHARAIATVLDELGVGPSTVVAHSMGGVVAIKLQGVRPDLVAKLVLANAGGIRLTPRRLALIVNGFRLFDRYVNRRPGAMRAIARRPRLRRLVFGGFVVDPGVLSGPFAAEVIPAFAAPGFVGALIAASKVAPEIDPSAIRCPVLLVWGAKDRILPLAAARELCRSLLDARLVTIENAAHGPMFETPDEFNRAVMRFV
jgi:pimeloyl-ACP methyl ester carboxylesterase